jgi:leader peptidase (prepilin peptidase)/N-methyltransferase
VDVDALASTDAPVLSAGVVLICGLLGLLIGSFVNVVIWRVPRKESVVTPRSQCPHCGTGISWRDNIPLLSWLLLRGRCRHCSAAISAKYPAVELTCGILCAAIGVRFHDSWALPAYLIFASGLLAISVIDLEHYVIPNRIVYPMGLMALPLLALAAGLEGEWWWFTRALIGAAGAFAALYAIWFVAPRAMGFGDVRLAFLLGLFLGWLGAFHVLLGIFLGFLYGAVIGIVSMAAGKRGRKDPIPFGPFLAAGALTVVLVGGPIVHWYQGASGV